MNPAVEVILCFCIPGIWAALIIIAVQLILIRQHLKGTKESP